MQLNGVWGTDREHPLLWSVWAVGQKGIVCSGKNDAATWSCTTLASQETLYSVSGDASRMEIWAVGEKGRIWLKSSTDYMEKMWGPSASGTTQWLNSVFSAPNGRVWAVGNNGTILRYN